MKLNKFIDHTLLKPEATKTQIDQIIKEAIDNQFFSVMVNPYWVKYVHEAVKNSGVKTATVIGFPLGANTTTIKVAEAEEAIDNGADEVDMVMNIGELKGGNTDVVKEDIKQVTDATHDRGKLIKVIIETALLTDDEITLASKIVADAGADFVKTSTGFSTRGAQVHDVELMKAAVGDKIKVKAAGGIHSDTDAEAMIKAGASRLGTSASLAIISKQS
ncbi:deoxyribose-phosphate aldolase [Agrilactobacillus composti DSM 18527 = JCM 14202]|uniref:Deoxyribose-phosphate aldolase n=1 Tax=Agrilactobacillus composti DSM 18527 = JCM 14202 TaxID=1423734 RepID=X0PDC1_9LACO|nr:deoxyribose-phosphate aldolase [Agrilactobacillus composti]KRM30412.1 deoxyribose-phosphate aldolase [Agrilactobacillus composti DSM 18527 = JCM 14202]GAF38883.1 deoxyribose-phosphate aldolase [Agrilactobacillus composti DSM 18527 = JCM 14202]